MKRFIRMRGSSNLLEVRVIEPRINPSFSYHYPDGISEKKYNKGKEIFFVSSNNREILFRDPQEALDWIDPDKDENYFIEGGKIMEPWKLVLVISGIEEPGEIKTKNFQDLKKALENLMAWGINLGDYMSLDDKSLETLWDYLYPREDKKEKGL